MLLSSIFGFNKTVSENQHKNGMESCEDNMMRSFCGPHHILETDAVFY